MKKTNGLIDKKLYGVWRGMRQRCNNPNTTYYYLYGGRGISVCKEWDSYEVFFSDMAPSYKIGLQLDRINNNGGYSKENCRWATAVENMSNTRANIKWKGETAIAASRRLGGCDQLVRGRISMYGWSYEEAFTTSVHEQYHGETRKKLGKKRGRYNKKTK